MPIAAFAQPNFGTTYLNNSSLPTGDVRDVAINLINILLGILATIALIGVIAGGFMIMTAGGDTGRESKGRSVAGRFIIGLIIIFLAFAITQFVFNILYTAAS